MSQDRWNQVRELYHAARERGHSVLDGADPEVRCEVESLLAQDPSEDALEHPPLEVLRAMAGRTMAPGMKLGSYELVARVGAGGMGEVWKARDTRLNRSVAIKISSERFSDRFEREARAIAALNHPHICQIYDVGPDYLVMEFVHGKPVKGPMPLDVALKRAIELAGAMEAAHRSEITHRDLKPDNIFDTKSGIKVLDFGLAKVNDAKGAPGAADPTRSMQITQEGTIIGTLQYMAPEQLQGQKADSRADIFAFGCVLYEMLTGKRAFDGSNSASVIAAILEREPPSVSTVAPSSLDWVIRRCFAKNPEERWQTARDLRAALERVSENAEAAAKPRGAKPGYVAAMAALMIALGAGSAYYWNRISAPSPLPIVTDLAPPPGTSGGILDPEISPDGHKIIFFAETDGKTRLWYRSLDSRDAIALTGTEGAFSVFWSPDSKSVGFSTASKLMTMEVPSGRPSELVSGYTRAGLWNESGAILFAASDGIHVISASGGNSRMVRPAGVKPLIPTGFLPDSHHFLYEANGEIRIADLDSKDDHLLAPGITAPRYSQGYLIYSANGAFMARPFDDRRLMFTGDAVRVLVGAGANFSISGNGILVGQSPLKNRRIAWVDRAGGVQGYIGDSSPLDTLRISPDGKTLLTTEIVASADRRDIWVYDLVSGRRASLVSGAGRNFDPIWSPDGRNIIFLSNRNGVDEIYRRSVDGSGQDQLVYGDKAFKDVDSISPDGRYLLYHTGAGPTNADIWVLPNPLSPAANSKPYPLLQTTASEWGAQFSPDGKWIAYVSDQSGELAVWAMPFPGPGPRRQISTNLGVYPFWSHDGKELFFISQDDHLMSARLDFTNGLTVKDVHALFDTTRVWTDSLNIAAAPDGKRFLALTLPESEPDPPFTVIQNWTALLKRK